MCCTVSVAGSCGAGIPSVVGLECMHRQLGRYGGEASDGESVQRSSSTAATAAAADGAGKRSEACLSCRTHSSKGKSTFSL